MVKFTILLRRKPSMSHAEFVAYHRERHASLFCALPAVRQHVRRYVQCHTVPASVPGLPPVTFDGITELWFDDVAGRAGGGVHLRKLHGDDPAGRGAVPGPARLRVRAVHRERAYRLTPAILEPGCLSMSYSRRSVDLSGYPDLVVVYLGYRAKGLKGARSLLRIGRGLRSIKENPPDGLLSHEGLWFGFLHPGFRQYWRDFDSLEAFTRAPQHRAWWRDFARDSEGEGIWHETYRLRGGMEAIYSGVPGIGLASFAPERVPNGAFMSARQRVEAGVC